jgi:hypothetical protein
MATSRFTRTRWLATLVLALLATLLQIAPAAAQSPGGFCTLTPNGDGTAALEWNVDGGQNRETSIRVDDRWLFTAAIGETTATIPSWDEGASYSIRQWKQSTRFDFACTTPSPAPTPNGWCVHSSAGEGALSLEWNVDGGTNRETNIRVDGEWITTVSPGVTTAEVAATSDSAVLVRQWKQADRFDYLCTAAEPANEDPADDVEDAADETADDGRPDDAMEEEAGEDGDGADDNIPVDLPAECDALFLPGAADVAVNNLSTLDLITLLDDFGADVALFATPERFVFANWDYTNPVVGSIVNSWFDDAPFPEIAPADLPEDIPAECFGPIPEEELAQQQAFVDALVAAFIEAGIEHEVISDGPFSFVDYDTDDEEAVAIEFAVAEQIFGPFEPVPEEALEEQRAFNDALAEAFTAAGIAFERVTLPDGWELIEFDVEDEAALEIEMQVAEEFFGGFDDGFDPNLCFVPEFEPGFLPEFEPRDLSLGELERIDELNAAIASAFDAEGIPFTINNDGSFPQISWDFLDRAANTVADAAYRSVVGDALIDDDFIPEDVLEQIQAETDALAVAFDNAGVPYMIVTDEFGFTSIEYDFTDEQAQAIADAVFEELYGPFEGIPEAELERMAAVVDALVAEFDAAGIEYAVVEDPFGGTYVEFDYEDPTALEIHDRVQMDVYYAPCDEIPAFVERLTLLEQLADELTAAGVKAELLIDGPFVALTFDVTDPNAMAVVQRYL